MIKMKTKTNFVEWVTKLLIILINSLPYNKRKNQISGTILK